MSFFVCGTLKENDNRSRAQRRQDYRAMKKHAQQKMHTEPRQLQLDNPFVTPDQNDSLWRYYSNIDYFIWLLDKGLFFTKIALFEDETEGNLPEKHNREIIEIANEINENFNPQWVGDTVIGSNPPFHSKMDAESISRQMFASCWNLGEDQDINFWERYGNAHVAIKTTVNRIKKGVPGYNTKYGISKITYVDYADESVDFNLGIKRYSNNYPRDNPIFNYRRFLHKGTMFQNENEVRLILFDSYYTDLLVDYIHRSEVRLIELKIDQNRFRNVWYSVEINDSGIYLPIEDLKILVDQIVISEHASKDTKEKIVNAAKRHGLEDRIVENPPSQRQRVFAVCNPSECG